MRTPRSRKEMIHYLSHHFRYNTMNSWNNSTSYAANVKVQRLEFPDSETRSRAYDLVGTAEAQRSYSHHLDEFAEEQLYSYQAGFNGRSSGYIVLYHGYRKLSQHKSCCSNCGQWNFQSITMHDRRCGRCGKDTRYDATHYDVGVWPGRDIDMGADFEDWDMDSLRDRVQLVVAFDRMVEQCVRSFVQFCQSHKAVEETYYVPKTRTVAQEL